MSEQPTPTRPTAEPSYLRLNAQAQFSAALASVSWQLNRDYNLLVLQAPCPICQHADGINTSVPITGALWSLASLRAATASSGDAGTPEYVYCVCAENHDQPPGTTGCGRWGMIIPHVAEGGETHAQPDR